MPPRAGEVSNIVFEDITLANAATAVSIGADYGGNACPCKWMTNYGGPGQQGECRSYGPTLKGAAHWAAGFVGVGGAPEPWCLHPIWSGGRLICFGL